MVSETKIVVRYPDTDAMGIVHHAVYPIWYEVARMDFFAQLGFPYTAMHEKGINPPMVNLNVSFKATVSYPGTVTIRTRCAAFGPKKLKLAYETSTRKVCWSIPPKPSTSGPARTTGPSACPTSSQPFTTGSAWPSAPTKKPCKNQNQTTETV